MFKVELNEAESPRGRAVQAAENIESESLYKCLGCKLCAENCPVKFDLKIEEIREKLVELGFETEANKRMIKNVRQYGNPFGEAGESFVPIELHCC